MRIYIPAARRAALMLFRRGSDADHARADALSAQREAVAADIYTGIMTGTVSEAHQITNRGHLLTIWHRSTRGDMIQESHFTRRSPAESWTASSHRDITTPAAIDITGGQYITITKEAQTA